MTKLLASVRNLEEARLALAGGADIIDLKEPSQGALGAVAPDVACAVVEFVARRVPVSATIGDVPWRADALAPAVAAMAASGVDYVKIGLFLPTSAKKVTVPDAIEQVRGVLRQSQLHLVAQPAKLIAVLFADQTPEVGVIAAFAEAGFAGVMLDTADKSRGGLRNHIKLADLSAFCRRVRQQNLLLGLAGSLRPPDIAALLPLAPDYLGFRGALCDGDDRVAHIAPARIRAVRALFSPALAQV
jgi:dihydroneopterin aldolase